MPELPKPRGDLSQALLDALSTDPATTGSLADIHVSDDQDAQIALWTLYELHHCGFGDVDESLEWDPELLRVRRRLEQSFESDLRARHANVTVEGPFEEALFAYIEEYEGPSLASFVKQRATKDQVFELLSYRSIYHLQESDPVAWLVPRLPVVPKAALMEVQYDEYGAGNPERLHAYLFAQGMEASGLRSDYGAYIDDAPCEVLEINNAMSMFGLHRRLRGAALGHLAAFEASSSLPSRKMAQGLERLGFPAEMIDYYTEHVEADAVHEQLAVRAICGPLVAEEPGLSNDVFFGAFTCLNLEDRFATRLIREWNDD